MGHAHTAHLYTQFTFAHSHPHPHHLPVHQHHHKNTPDQFWRKPNRTDPIYAIKHCSRGFEKEKTVAEVKKFPEKKSKNLSIFGEKTDGIFFSASFNECFLSGCVKISSKPYHTSWLDKLKRIILNCGYKIIFYKT